MLAASAGPFTYQGVAAMLAAIHRSNTIFPLRAWHGQPGVILRHDIDLDVDMAVRLAEVESNIGIRSTFLFLTNCDSYNLASAANRRHLRQLNDGGFEIGLHFDPTIYGDADLEKLTRHAASERSLIEDIVGAPVKSISLHNPSVHGQYLMFPGWINAYDPAIFNADCYLSDSRMNFRVEPQQFFAERRERICQLLLHPMHYSADGAGYPVPLARHIQLRADALNDMFLGNAKYREAVAERDLWSLIAQHATRKGKP